jgi:micrococcal nuclease
MDSGLWYYRADLYRVIDGDTIEVGIDLGFRCSYRTSLRILGIDAPERRKATMVEWHAAREYVQDWMRSASALDIEWPLRIYSQKPDSFGRWLGDVYNSIGESLSESIIDAGLAVPYTD